MSAGTFSFPRAFAVRFRDMDRWDPTSFHRITWHWPQTIMRPLGSVLVPRKEKIDRAKVKFAELQPITIHFDGSIDKREVDSGREYTMDLFAARPGDVVVAKIDLKNGAVAIVPDGWTNVAVTGHFAVYEPDRSTLVPEYLRLLIQTRSFKAHLWRNKVGAEGRKEVKLDFLESEPIPLPPLAVQRRIVAAWQAAQKAVAATRAKIERLERAIEARFLADLGLRAPVQTTLPKAFAVRWKDLPRWSVLFNQLAMTAIDLGGGKYPVVHLGEVAAVSYGIQKCPANRPGQHPRPYLRVANVQRGELDLSEIKYIDVPDKELVSLRLELGDMLFVEGNGSRDELGRCALWGGHIADCVHQNHILRVRPDSARLLSDYAMTWFNSSLGKDHFFRNVKTSSGLGSINSTELRAAPVPLPAIAVQRQISDRVAERRDEIAKLRAEVKAHADAAKADVEAMILGTKPVDSLSV
jgi:type I restriction enzyme S subunit